MATTRIDTENMNLDSVVALLKCKPLRFLVKFHSGDFWVKFISFDEKKWAVTYEHDAADLGLPSGMRRDTICPEDICAVEMQEESGPKKMEFLVYEHDVLSALCKGKNKWGMRICFDPDEPWDEVAKAAPYLNKEAHVQIFMKGEAYFFFDTKEEMERAFWSTVGDDGPTKFNSYNGPIHVYATTCDPTGQGLNENT